MYVRSYLCIPTLMPCISASLVAQVRLVFEPVIRGDSKPLPSYLSGPLIYVNHFSFVSSPDERPDVAMWTVQRKPRQGQDGRYGTVVPLTNVTHVVELIPDYGEKADGTISSATALESYKHFFLNNFADKECYHSLSTEFY